ncbi:hypothetical protein ElyMa_004066400 [Elysia marginata]|uniref:Uncharacterized protein n=1 Tax=Elysia marginata TaxID=1093978 RepID=A0AAV4G6E3_9GAST|nr:hypothetical protein ElyMa_004066400 [Elysia marginata]
MADGSGSQSRTFCDPNSRRATLIHSTKELHSNTVPGASAILIAEHNVAVTCTASIIRGLLYFNILFSPRTPNWIDQRNDTRYVGPCHSQCTFNPRPARCDAYQF